MPAPGKQLYFIALIPPSPVKEEAWTLKEYFRDHYHSKASLNSPPHITLHMPFEWKEAKEGKLIHALREFSLGKKAFTLSFNDFSCFEPRVIYIDVKQSESLTALQYELHRFCKINLNLFNAKYRDLPFHPHLTLAFRDLKKDQFAKAWEEFKVKKFSAEYLVEQFTLLKHDGNRWNHLEDFHF
jgi:2'-5' RNA ligase